MPNATLQDDANHITHERVRKSIKLVSGVGITDIVSSHGGRQDAAYKTWHNMLDRCYRKKRQAKHPSYIGCSVCEEWLTYSNFKRWYDDNYRDGYQLDKDILVQGNKVYSPDKCCFVPERINKILVGCTANRGTNTLGVSVRKPRTRNRELPQRFCGSCSILGNRVSKEFGSLGEAQAWYVRTKTDAVACAANEAYASGDIDARVRDALMGRYWSKEA